MTILYNGLLFGPPCKVEEVWRKTNGWGNWSLAAVNRLLKMIDTFRSIDPSWPGQGRP